MHLHVAAARHDPHDARLREFAGDETTQVRGFRQVAVEYREIRGHGGRRRADHERNAGVGGGHRLDGVEGLDTVGKDHVGAADKG